MNIHTARYVAELVQRGVWVPYVDRCEAYRAFDLSDDNARELLTCILDTWMNPKSTYGKLTWKQRISGELP